MENQMKDLALAEQKAEQRNVKQPDGVVHKGKPKNQNQQHNVKKEGIGRLNQMR